MPTILMGGGTRREVSLAKAAGLEMGASGAIKVDFRQQTSQWKYMPSGTAARSFTAVCWVYFLGDIANNRAGLPDRISGAARRNFPALSAPNPVFDLKWLRFGRRGHPVWISALSIMTRASRRQAHGSG